MKSENHETAMAAVNCLKNVQKTGEAQYDQDQCGYKNSTLCD